MLLKKSLVSLFIGSAWLGFGLEECGKIRILGFYLQDTTNSYSKCLGAGMPFELEVSKFMDSTTSSYPGSMFGVYGYNDRLYSFSDAGVTAPQWGDFVLLTPLVDVPTAKTFISKIYQNGYGFNTNAYDIMWHIISNGTDSGLDSVSPLPDTYDAKVLYVFTDGIPEYLESTTNDCNNIDQASSYVCKPTCNGQWTKCCGLDNTPVTSNAFHGGEWNSHADCPIDLASLGKKIIDDDWYVAYIAGSDYPDKAYNWSRQVEIMGIQSRFAFLGVNYQYTGLSNVLGNITNTIMCSTIPSNIPQESTTTSRPNTTTTSNTVATTTSTERASTVITTSITTSITTAIITTTTTTEKPFPVGLVCGCVAGAAVAAVAAAAGAVAANRLSGWPPVPEFEFEAEEGAGPEEMEREAQVALGETDYA